MRGVARILILSLVSAWTLSDGGGNLMHGGETVRSIHVRGEGKATSPPDIATIDTGVSTMEASAAEALRSNTAAMNQVMAALREHDIAAKDIQTSQFHINPEYAPNNQSMTLVGYRVSNQVQVRVRDLSKVGKLLDALIKSGSNQVSGVQFGIDNPQAILDQARERAIQEARRRAELYAKAAGVKVGGVISIEEQISNPMPGPVMMRAMASESSSVPIATGEQMLEAVVDVRFELIP